MKTNKNEIFMLKFIIVIIINIWLLFILWRIILFNGLNFTNNNVFLKKMNTVMQPLLFALGIDYLSPNTIKMVIISTIVFGVNLSVLYFNQMALLIISIAFARYGYKSYSNYLINKENMHYMGFETVKQPDIIQNPIIKTVEQTPVIIETTTNWWLWGTIITVGVIAVAGVAIAIWSHNTNAGNILSVNENVGRVNTALNNVNNNLSERITRNVQQIDYNNNYTTKMVNELNTKTNLIDHKVTNLENTVQSVGENLTRVGELNNENVLKLSQESLRISHQAKEALTEIAESSSTVEATTLGFAKLWEIVKEYTERVETLENKAGIQQVQTPRNINTLNITKKHGEL